MRRWRTVIGLEVHAQVLSARKAFCFCPTTPSEANSNTCAICLGEAGSLPVLNLDAVRVALRAAAALRCSSISETLEFDRKSYSYPDLPKGYQITQRRKGLGAGGCVEFEAEGVLRRVGLEGAHFEEDSAKTTYRGDAIDVDYNRCGRALVEIVTLPELESGSEAAACAREIQRVLRRAGASEARFEEGSMRVDVNVSVRDDDHLRPKVEVKNLNSLRAVRAACDYEARRQAEIYDAGGVVAQETRSWDGGETVRSRAKGGAEVYRYAPEPDLPPRPLESLVGRSVADHVDALRREIEPHIPAAVRARLRKRLDPLAAAGLVDADDYGRTARVAFFDACVAHGAKPKPTAAWILGDVAGALRKLEFDTIADSNLSPVDLAELLALLDQGTVSRRAAKDLLPDLLQRRTSSSVEDLVFERGLARISDVAALRQFAREALDAHPNELAAYHAGKKNLEKLFIGKALAASGGRADPVLMRDVVRDCLLQAS
ncbi:hypothetical protein CTAYLR_006616 [Chrysophaeum taylorii]|uniref:Glutamyl-tRNA(Gln) amidotransferase subunit B, mitochondrial n=1 Tax=Chrysophaeum taylorii TaxID=2483200 RepID=A0AAD7ULS2_9STRA|nr:hypothetical protein CTAYLR_006616 [Chrysophaeum taylorii]